MSLRHKEPDREEITIETVVFDDLADLLIELRAVIPESIIPERNGVGFDTLVESFVQMSTAIARFEATDEGRHITDYTRLSDEAATHLDLLRFRVSKYKEALAKRIIAGDVRGSRAKAINCLSTMTLMRRTMAMMRSKAVRERERTNKEWDMGTGERRAAMLAEWERKREEKILRRQENKMRWIRP